jgi:hypothetical protein
MKYFVFDGENIELYASDDEAKIRADEIIDLRIEAAMENGFDDGSIFKICYGVIDETAKNGFNRFSKIIL